jgi:23S rRNA (guanosine2251-2'-O)-methyltransferase
MPHFIPGFHAVKETLIRDKGNLEALWIESGKRSSRIKEILSIANKKRIPIVYTDGDVLDNLLPGVAHQGIAALAEKFRYRVLKDLIEASMHPPGHALLLAADHITDEGNLGALIRTAAFFGAHGLILPKDRSARITETVKKRSSGGYVHLPAASVVNLGRALDTLKERGFWIIGADGSGPESLYDFDWNRDLVLVLGSEDRGLSRNVKKRCHERVCIPRAGGMASLNVSVASGVILSEIVRQRNTAGD